MSWLKLWVRDLLSVAFWLGRRLSGRGGRPGVRILLYHAIVEIPPRADRWRMSVPPALFAAHLAWLRRHGYTVVSLAEAVEMVQGARPMADKAVAITFDDGFRDALLRAYPILERAQVPAAVFVVAGSLGAPEPFPWLDNRAAFDRPLAWEELQQLVSDPLVSVGSHTWSHQVLSGLPLEEQDRELAQSKATIEARLGRPVRWCAYPYGHAGSFSLETIECVKRLGFEAACANVMGVNHAGDSPWALKRTRIGWEDQLWRFRLKMAGAYDWTRWIS